MAYVLGSDTNLILIDLIFKLTFASFITFHYNPRNLRQTDM